MLASSSDWKSACQLVCMAGVLLGSALSLEVLADSREPASVGVWSDRFVTDNIIDNPLETYHQLAAGGDAIYSGPYRLTDGTWTRLGEAGRVEILVTAASGDDVYIAGYSLDDDRRYFVAHWDGESWVTIAQKMDERIFSMVVHNGDLYVGGWFSEGDGITAARVARWDGNSWTQIGEDPPYAVRSLTFVGNTLYAGGGSGGYSPGYVARWNGSSWTEIGVSDAIVNVVFGMNGDLYAGGYFFHVAPNHQSNGIEARRIAKWNGSVWSPLGSGIGIPVFGPYSGPHVATMTAFGSELIVGGYFDRAGPTNASGVARWNGTSWSAFGSGTRGEVDSLAVLDGQLYVGGYMDLLDGATVGGAAKWNGKSWVSIGDWGPTFPTVSLMLALEAHDGALVAGGLFETAGGTEVHNIARWDGITWSSLGSGTDGWVYAIAFDGADIVAGGTFLHAGGIAAARVARWDGSEWSALGDGPVGDVYDLLFVGDDLYASGLDRNDGPFGKGFVAKWDGAAWTTIVKANGPIATMAVFGDKLHVGGDFSEIGGVAANRVARFDGDTWAALGQGFNRNVWELAARDGELWAVGSFYVADQFEIADAAVWDGTQWRSAGVPSGANTVEFIGDDVYVAGGDLVRADGDEWVTVDPAYIGGMAGVGSQLYVSGYFQLLGDKRAVGFGALATGDCGNGVLDEGEQCDPNLEGTGICCNLNDCSIASSGTICRQLRGPCDVAETCDGSTTICPDDAIADAGVTCLENLDPCAPLHECDGEGLSCPTEEREPCDDGNPCNGTEVCGEGGSCSNGELPDCDDGAVCTADSCAADEGCIHDWTPGAGCAYCGDTDEDGEIGAEDALISLRAAVGLEPCPTWICDYDGNGTLNTSDALRVLKVSVGLTVEPQCSTRVG